MSENTACNSNPRISIITVCYNEMPANIKKTFSSIVSQDYQNIQWIVVDGGSNQETLAAIHEFSNGIDVLISEPDSGIYDAMNKGLKHATGDFINFMNVGDGFISSKIVRSMAEFISNNPNCDCYYGDVIYVAETLGSMRTSYQLPQVNLRNLYKWTICHQAIFASRNVFGKVGDFNLQYRICADKDWIIRSVKAGNQWMHTGLIICEYEACGMSSEVAKTSAENAILRFRHYRTCQRGLLWLYWKVVRGWLKLAHFVQRRSGLLCEEHRTDV